MRWSYTEKQMRKKEKQNKTFKDYMLASKNFSAIIVGVQITFLARRNENNLD
jgi:F0F1-type ATP synthase assembly protein I